MLLKNFKIEDDSIRSARRILLFCHFHFFFFFFLCLNSKSFPILSLVISLRQVSVTVSVHTRDDPKNLDFRF